MAEFVRKGVVGYAAVRGGQSDPDCTHVIMTLKEYEKIQWDKAQALRDVGIERDRADRGIEEARRDVAYQVYQIKTEVTEEVAAIQDELERVQHEAEYQHQLNEDLLRISRERSNADRKLRPKKEHTGYVVLSSNEKELRRKDRGRSSYYYITLWETVLQSPYSVEFTEEQARRQICEDLMLRNEGEDWPLARLGIYEKPEPKPYSSYDDEEDDQSEDDRNRENILLRYRLSANYQARRGQEVGFWEIVLTHKKPLLRVPRDMRGS